MMSVRIAAIVATALLLPATNARAQTLAAMIEDVQGKPPGVEMMDYVVAHRMIKLGPRDTIVLSYFKSCLRETITGGTVTIGAEQSDVRGGNVSREKVPCDAGKMQLSVEQASKSGAMAFRDVVKPQNTSRLALRPQFFLHGASPVVHVTKGKPVLIERVDQPGERYEIGGDRGPPVRGAYYDFADDNKALAAAGIYRATQGAVQVLFQVDPDAKSGKTPVVGRLLRLQPPT